MSFFGDGVASDPELRAAPAKGNSAVSLTPAEVAELREIFQLVDKDGGGSISKTELGSLMAQLGIRCSQEELDLMMREVDSDGSGEVSSFGGARRVRCSDAPCGRPHATLAQ